jgi:hypothetical protein
MASGDTLCAGTALGAVPRASSSATLDIVNEHTVIDFDAATAEGIVFPIVISNVYGAGNIDVRLIWTASTATSGNVVWEVSLERHEDDATDLDSDSFGTVVTGTAATASAAGEPQYTAITLDTAAERDSIAAGEHGRLLVRRLGADGSDTMAGDANLRGFELRESS